MSRKIYQKRPVLPAIGLLCAAQDFCKYPLNLKKVLVERKVYVE